MSRPNPMPRMHRWRSNVIQAPLFFLATAIFRNPRPSGVTCGEDRANPASYRPHLGPGLCAHFGVASHHTRR